MKNKILLFFLVFSLFLTAVAIIPAPAEAKVTRKVTNVSVTGRYPKKIDLQWKKKQKVLVGQKQLIVKFYQVKVSKKVSGKYKKIKRVKTSKNIRTKTITKLSNSTTYYFQVRACKTTAKCGIYSDRVKGKTKDAVDPTPDPTPDPAPDPDEEEDGVVPTIGFGASAFSGSESSGSIPATISLSSVSANNVTVDYATSDGTAVAGTDYVAASGTATIPAGETSVNISVIVTSDTNNEGNETVILTLSNPTNATLGTTNNPITITINDDDSLAITSPTFSDGGNIPDAYTCAGADISPGLSWTGTPSGTQSFVLIVRDIDAPGGDFFHWGVRNISSASTGFDEDDAVTDGEQVANDFSVADWRGPCPPVEDGAHSYQFEIYALSTSSVIAASASELDTNIQSYILESAYITGEYDRN